MKQIFGSKIIIILCIAAIFGFSLGLLSQEGAEAGEKQLVRVSMKSGDTLLFEYRSFLEMNFDVQTGNPAMPNPAEDFGEKRVVFTEQGSCTEHRISLDNLEEIEFIGIAHNKCTDRKEWVFKVNLLDCDKYVGFFKPAASNINKSLAEHGMMGQVLDKSEAKELPFDGIASIRFFPR